MLVMESGEEKQIEKLVLVCMPQLRYPPGLQHTHALLWLAGKLLRRQLSVLIKSFKKN